MSDVLCIFYSRTGHTRRAMEEVAETLGAELVPISDQVYRKGWTGWLRCGMDAMRKDTAPLRPFETEKPLEAYRAVILGTPVWAGRCSSVIRGFLKAYGRRLPPVGFVLTRGSGEKYEEVYRQMDGYLSRPHIAAVSLRSGSVGYAFWEEDFLRQIREFLAGAGEA